MANKGNKKMRRSDYDREVLPFVVSIVKGSARLMKVLSKKPGRSPKLKPIIEAYNNAADQLEEVLKGTNKKTSTAILRSFVKRIEKALR